MSDGSGSETYDLLVKGVGQLRLAALVIERVLRVKECDDPATAELVRQQRETADAMARHAAEVRPSPAMTTFERGQREAMKDWRPAAPGRPS